MKQRQAITIVTLLLMTLSVIAAQNKKQQPVFIHSNSMHFDLVHHTSVYKGNAVATQADSVLKGDVITAHQNQYHKIDRVITTGKPAYFSKSNKDSHKPPLQSKADTIYFYPLRHLAILKGHAWAKQGKDDMTGYIIKYNTQSELLYGINKPHQQVHLKLVNGSLQSANQ